jgi:hypothetical protein
MGEGEKASDHWAKALKETSDDKVKSESQKRLDEAKSKAKK